MPNKLLKVWENFEARIGYLVDDGRTPGVWYAEGMIGTRTELRPAPAAVQTDINAQLGAGTDLRALSFFEEDVGDGVSYLYFVIVDNDGTSLNKVLKIDLRFAGFGALLQLSKTLSAGFLPSKAVRYNEKWYISGNPAAVGIEKLLTIGVGAAADTWTTGAAGTGAHQLVVHNMQMSSARQSLGLRLLKVDGTPGTAAHWGPYYQSGDKEDLPQALFSLEGGLFVLKSNGLFSFIPPARSAEVIGSIAGWAGAQRERRQVVLWAGGAVFATPGGLAYYRPGSTLQYIGVETLITGTTSPLPGPSRLVGGRYLGVNVINEMIYAIYQPNVESASALLLVGIPVGGGQTAVPALAWHVLRVFSLPAKVTSGTFNGRFVFQDVGISVSGYPTASKIQRPSVWYSVATTDIEHLVLGQNGSPLRDRSDSHVITLSGDTYLSELRFEEPHDLYEIIVYAADFVTGDELQLKSIDQHGAEQNIGAPIRSTTATRQIRTFNLHNVQRLMLHLNWAGTSVTSRTPPAIIRIELWGRPSRG